MASVDAIQWIAKVWRRTTSWDTIGSRSGGPSSGRPSACLSITCWSYLYFESSCFEQDLLQLSFLKNKQQFAGNFKYHHTLSLFITLQCLTRVCFDNWRSNPSDKEFGLKFPCLEQPPSREARTRGWEVEEVDQKPAWKWNGIISWVILIVFHLLP